MKMADAKQKRNEQLKRWIGSETDLEPPVVKRQKTKVKFDDGAVFLAACSSGDTDEVLKLLHRGADINYANVDGLTALHQVCAPAVCFLTLWAFIGLPPRPPFGPGPPEAGGWQETPCCRMRGRLPAKEGGREGSGLEAPFRPVVGAGIRVVSGAEGKRDCGRLGAPGSYVGMYLGFKVETGRIVVWLCLGPDVSDILGGWQMLKKMTNKGY